MRLGFAKIKEHKRNCFAPAFPCLGLYVVLFIFSVVMLSADALADNKAAKHGKTLDPSKIEFPKHDTKHAIKDLGVALQRHPSGRIKTYFQAGEAWRIGADAFTFSNDFADGAYAAEDGVKVTMLDETGKRLFWIDADKACVYLNDKIGKCFGAVKLESPEIEMFGTNLLWNTATTNLFTIEKNVMLRIKNLDSQDLKRNK